MTQRPQPREIPAALLGLSGLICLCCEAETLLGQARCLGIGLLLLGLAALLYILPQKQKRPWDSRPTRRK